MTFMGVKVPKRIKKEEKDTQVSKKGIGPQKRGGEGLIRKEYLIDL